MLTEEEYIKKNAPHLGLKTARKMYNQYVNIENIVKDCCQSDPVAKAPWPTDSNWPAYNFEFASITTMDCPAPTKKSGLNWKCPVEQCEEQQGNKPMTDTEVSRNYLATRLDSVSRTKRNELPGIFNLYAPTSPKNYKEFIDWVKNDKFKLDAKMIKRIDASIDESDGTYYGSFLDGIIWTGAAKVPDPDGYNAAEKERVVKAQAVKDVIYTSDAATALKALQDFEAWTPGPTTVAN